MTNPYPGGQCTWGAAEMCPCLQNLSTYGNFGNGGDWYAHAQSIGLPTSVSPQTGWLASFSTGGWPNGDGDVGMIVSVNTDGTLTRYGTNWHMDLKWSTDRVKQSLMIGCFKPPCDCAVANGMPVSAALFSSSGNCHTFKWDLALGQSVCFDGIVGMLSVGGGLLLMATGLVILALGIKGKHEKDKEAKPVQQQSAQQPQQPAQASETDPKTAQQPQPLSAQQQQQLASRARQRAQARALDYKRPGRSTGKVPVRAPVPPVPVP